jgi:hypothetical protein
MHSPFKSRDIDATAYDINDRKLSEEKLEHIACNVEVMKGTNNAFEPAKLHSTWT